MSESKTAQTLKIIKVSTKHKLKAIKNAIPTKTIKQRKQETIKSQTHKINIKPSKLAKDTQIN